jgi:hypothetical protein
MHRGVGACGTGPYSTCNGSPVQNFELLDPLGMGATWRAHAIILIIHRIIRGVVLGILSDSELLHGHVR